LNWWNNLQGGRAIGKTEDLPCLDSAAEVSRGVPAVVPLVYNRLLLAVTARRDLSLKAVYRHCVDAILIIILAICFVADGAR
jgi:hypothetical protein